MARPLAGRRVVVTRSSEQAGTLAARLVARGATPVVVPLVTIEACVSEADRLATLDLTNVAWVVVTSPNGARALGRVNRGDPTCRPSTAAVGSTTAAALEKVGWPADLVPHRQSAADLVAAMPAGEGMIVVVQAADAAPTVADGLARKGWTVDVVRPYRTVAVMPDGPARAAALAADALLLASGSAARSWVASFGADLPRAVVAIGPQTAEVARSVGIRVDAIAEDHSLDGLVAALEALIGS